MKLELNLRSFFLQHIPPGRQREESEGASQKKHQIQSTADDRTKQPEAQQLRSSLRSSWPPTKASDQRDDSDDMMDLRTHAWPSAAAAGDASDDVKMLLADLDTAANLPSTASSSSSSSSSAAHLARSLEADASTMVLMMLLPGGDDASAAATSATFSEEEQQRELSGDTQESPDFNDDNDFDADLWTAAAPDEPFDLMDADDEPLTLADSSQTHTLAPSFSEVTGGGGSSGTSDAKKRRGRKPAAKSTAAPKKPKRLPPSPSKARLRNYERRSRTKREVRPVFGWCSVLLSIKGTHIPLSRTLC